MWAINIALSELAGNSRVSVFARLLNNMSMYGKSLVKLHIVVLI